MVTTVRKNDVAAAQSLAIMYISRHVVEGLQFEAVSVTVVGLAR
jgi:hypothetical protein